MLDVGESSHFSSNQGPSVFLVLGSVSPGPWSQRSCRLVTHLDRFHGKAPVREAPNLEKKIKLLLSKFVVYSYGLRVYMFANIQFNQKKKNPKTFVSTHLQLVVITPHPVVHRALSWPGIKLPCVSSLVRVGRLLRPLVPLCRV